MLQGDDSLLQDVEKLANVLVAFVVDAMMQTRIGMRECCHSMLERACDVSTLRCSFPHSFTVIFQITLSSFLSLEIIIYLSL